MAPKLTLWRFVKNHAWHLLAFWVVVPGSAYSIVWLGASSVVWECVGHGLLIMVSVLFGSWLSNTWLTESGALMRASTMAKWHYPDVAENSNPPLTKDGEPIMDVIKWFAADRECSREFAAWVYKYHENPREIDAMHKAYLRGFKVV